MRVVIDRATVRRLSAWMINAARKDWMTLENLDTDMPLTDDFAQPPLLAFGGRVRCRSIYATAVVDHPRRAPLGTGLRRGGRAGTAAADRADEYARAPTVRSTQRATRRFYPSDLPCSDPARPCILNHHALGARARGSSRQPGPEVRAPGRPSLLEVRRRRTAGLRGRWR